MASSPAPAAAAATAIAASVLVAAVVVMGPVAVEMVVVVVVEFVVRRTIFLFLLGKPPRPLCEPKLGGLPSGGPCAMMPCWSPSATAALLLSPLVLVLALSTGGKGNGNVDSVIEFCIFDLAASLA
jgi:hypothetical protein